MMLHRVGCIDTKTESRKEAGRRAGDRDCERRRRDVEIVATVTETNESVKVENRVM